ncbi:uncharacterized protein K452DRAFT_308740 [Aplosporella prunicola CBS 121167]|uniref:Uncharacterized protein n=1 Tax=Aplosporella prunicola CBS 121167 TaxID=1176127 RepID=A0A6A6BE60_9PEZI|nr:uncharacterized protein K452DRAFT_308740 [Aplosporella prunicola CBS 121167]KAF2141663.1 hypothetical protein K452DRAFT_308740 [Aplosporella prunicola CBS 121167]
MCWPHIQIRRPGEGEDLFFSRPSKDFDPWIRNIIYDYCFDLKYINVPLPYTTYEEQRLGPKDEPPIPVGTWHLPPHGFVIFCLNRFMYFDASRRFYHIHFRHLTFQPRSFKELRTTMLQFPMALRSRPNVVLVLGDHGRNNLDGVACDAGLEDSCAPWVYSSPKHDGFDFQHIYGDKFHITMYRRRGHVDSICAHGKLGNLAWLYGYKARIDWNRTSLASTSSSEAIPVRKEIGSIVKSWLTSWSKSERPMPGSSSPGPVGEMLGTLVEQSMAEQPTTHVVPGEASGASPALGESISGNRETRDCSDRKGRQSAHELPRSSVIENARNNKRPLEQKRSSADYKRVQKKSQVASPLKENRPLLRQASKGSNQTPFPKIVFTNPYFQVAQEGNQTANKAKKPGDEDRSYGKLHGAFFTFRASGNGINTKSVLETEETGHFLLRPLEVRRKRKRVDSETNSTETAENESKLEFLDDDAPSLMTSLPYRPKSRPLIKVLEEQVFTEPVAPESNEKDAQGQHGQAAVFEETSDIRSTRESARRSARRASHALLIEELNQDTQTNDTSPMQSARTAEEASLSSSDTLIASAKYTHLEGNINTPVRERTVKRIRHARERSGSKDRIQLWLNRPDGQDYQATPAATLQCDATSAPGHTASGSTTTTGTLVQEPQQGEPSTPTASSANKHTAHQAKSRNPSRSTVLTNSSARSGSQSWITSCASSVSTAQHALQPPAATASINTDATTTPSTAREPSPTTTALAATTTTANSASAVPPAPPTTTTFPEVAPPLHEIPIPVPVPVPASALSLTPTRAWWETSPSAGGGSEARGCRSTGGARKRHGKGVRGAGGWSGGGGGGRSPGIGGSGSGSGRGVGKSSTRLEMATWIALDGVGK